MSDQSAIEWCDATWNVSAGCTAVSEGCRNCYACRLTARFGGREGSKYNGLARFKGDGAPPTWAGRVIPQSARRVLEEPLHWRDPRVVFVNSMSDLFHGGIYGQGHDDQSWVPGRYNASGFEFLLDVFNTMRQCPRHTFLILTKRPRIASDLLWRVHRKLNLLAPLQNVYVGTSAEDQATYEQRSRYLLDCFAHLLFLSLEPLLGPIELDFEQAIARDSRWRGNDTTVGPGFGWVICGGESGPGARPMHPSWPCAIRDECRASGVPFMFKQWGRWRPPRRFEAFDLDSDRKPRAWFVDTDGTRVLLPHAATKPEARVMLAVGKGKAGRRLEGRLHNGHPARRNRCRSRTSRQAVKARARKRARRASRSTATAS